MGAESKKVIAQLVRAPMFVWRALSVAFWSQISSLRYPAGGRDASTGNMHVARWDKEQKADFVEFVIELNGIRVGSVAQYRLAPCLPSCASF